MYYCSTRGGVKEATFESVARSGYADDGGLFMPHTIPSLNWAALIGILKDCESNEGKDGKGGLNLYQRIAQYIFSLFVFENEISKEEMEGIVRSSFSREKFDVDSTMEVVRMKKKGEKEEEGGGLYFAELFHGQTYAFKDLGILFIFELSVNLSFSLPSSSHRLGSFFAFS